MKHENRYDELLGKIFHLSEKIQREKTINATLFQNVRLLERQCEDATASVASSSFSKFSQEEFK